MSSDLYIYAQPLGVELTLQLDNGVTLTGQPCAANGRDDAFLFTLPSGTTPQGAVLTASYGGSSERVRGIIKPNEPSAEYQFDDFGVLTAAPTPPAPGPPKPPMTEPQEVVYWVYESGAYGTFDLGTHDGCGEFTEACVTCLHEHVSPGFGHIKKNPGQNQFNGHAVDALYQMGIGVYDIVLDSMSPNGTPQYIWKDEGDPALWYYPAAARVLMVSDPVKRAKL